MSASVGRTMNCAVVIAKAEDGSYSAYVPDLPGCVTSGDSIEEAKTLIAEAIALHLDSLRRHGEPTPRPSAKVFTVKAA